MHQALLMLAAIAATVVTVGCDGSDGGGAGSSSGLRPCMEDTDCDDNIECTTERCSRGTCVPSSMACETGTCDVRTGCVETGACSTRQDCDDDDVCTVNESCNPGSRTCEYTVLDGDGDGFIPMSCGGLDCDDADRAAPRVDEDACDRSDNDCDGEVDEGFDLTTDIANCGSCGQACESGICNDGKCAPCGDTDGACCTLSFAMLIDPETGAPTVSSFPRMDDGCRIFSDRCIDSICVPCGAVDQMCCEIGVPGEPPISVGMECAPVAECVAGICQRR